MDQELAMRAEKLVAASAVKVLIAKVRHEVARFLEVRPRAQTLIAHVVMRGLVEVHLQCGGGHEDALAARAPRVLGRARAVEVQSVFGLEDAVAERAAVLGAVEGQVRGYFHVVLSGVLAVRVEGVLGGEAARALAAVEVFARGHDEGVFGALHLGRMLRLRGFLGRCHGMEGLREREEGGVVWMVGGRAYFY